MMKAMIANSRKREEGSIGDLLVIFVLFFGFVALMVAMSTASNDARANSNDEIVILDMKTVQDEIELLLNDNDGNDIQLSVIGSPDKVKVSFGKDSGLDPINIAVSEGVRINGSGTQDSYTLLGQHRSGRKSNPGDDLDGGIVYESKEGIVYESKEDKEDKENKEKPKFPQCLFSKSYECI